MRSETHPGRPGLGQVHDVTLDELLCLNLNHFTCENEGNACLLGWCGLNPTPVRVPGRVSALGTGSSPPRPRFQREFSGTALFPR